nr:PhzF family phenazine biosynthesis protein [candidate division Zixibacteria bacterium]
MRPTFYIVDVFAENRYSGNQLAVFRNVAMLSDREMQDIAREMHYSETTFITSEKESEGGYNVRIFTPEHEMPFAGHPTLGTAFIIQREIIGRAVERVNLNLKVGQIPVTINYDDGRADMLWMKQKNPIFGKTINVSRMADALRLRKSDLDENFPVEEVSTGVPFFIVPLKKMEAVKRARMNLDVFGEIVKDTEANAILVFAPETESSKNQLHVRVFVDFHGIPEDPATGSANGCLAGYLVKHGYFGSNAINIKVEQGFEIKRPSLLNLKAEIYENGIDVRVGGRVYMVARGELV